MHTRTHYASWQCDPEHPLSRSAPSSQLILPRRSEAGRRLSPRAINRDIAQANRPARHCAAGVAILGTSLGRVGDSKTLTLLHICPFLVRAQLYLVLPNVFVHRAKNRAATRLISASCPRAIFFARPPTV